MDVDPQHYPYELNAFSDALSTNAILFVDLF